MKIIRNEKLINRNKQIGQWTSMAALAVLAGGMFISWQKPDLIAYAFAALLIGFTLTQVGMYMGNRFGRSPRLDEKLDASLKGLPSEFSIYHYITPASHLLVGPAGIWVLMPYHQRGQVGYKKGRWRMSGGGAFQKYMRVFGQESLGRPDLEIEGEIAGLRKALAGKMDESAIPDIQAVLVFTSDSVDLDTAEAPIPAVKLKQLKELIRQRAKEKPVGALALQAVKTGLEQ